MHSSVCICVYTWVWVREEEKERAFAHEKEGRRRRRCRVCTGEERRPEKKRGRERKEGALDDCKQRGGGLGRVEETALHC